MKIFQILEGLHEDHDCDGFPTFSPHTSSVTLLKGGKLNILVDTGAKGYDDIILEKLQEAEVKPENIHFIIHTHWHLDHVYNDFLFKHTDIVTNMLIWSYKKSWLHKDDWAHWGLDEIEIIHTPGHTEEHLAVLATDDDGKKWVMAGDAIREKSIREGNLPCKPENCSTYIGSALKIFEKADAIIPGHGPVIEGDNLKELEEIIRGLAK